MKRVTNLRKDVSLPMPDGTGLAPGKSVTVEDSVASSDRLAQWEKAKAIEIEDAGSSSPGDELYPDSEPAPLTPPEDKHEPKASGKKGKGKHAKAETAEIEHPDAPVDEIEPAGDETDKG